MLRRIAIAAALVIAALAPLAAAAQPMPRPDVVVEGDVVRLGDIFSDAGAAGRVAVAPSPLPGTRVAYNSDWLAAVAREHHLAWTPVSSYDTVTVERATRVLGADAIAARLLAEVATRAPVNDAEIRLDNPGLHLAVPAEATDAVAVDGLTLDPRSGRVSAVLSAPAGDPRAEHLRVTGRLVHFVEVPVLTRPLAPGDVIAAGDLDKLRVQRDRLNADTVTDAAQLVGKTPRRPLRAGQPLRDAEVQAPVVVRKGDLVTIVLETPTMRLTAQGKALDDGAMGAAIRVANTKSSRVIDAAVVAPNTVRIGGAARLAAMP